MNVFVQKLDGFKNNRIFASDTDSLYVEKKYAENLMKEKGVFGYGS